MKPWMIALTTAAALAACSPPADAPETAEPVTPAVATAETATPELTGFTHAAGEDLFEDDPERPGYQPALFARPWSR